jgi:hypothetical protein
MRSLASVAFALALAACGQNDPPAPPVSGPGECVEGIVAAEGTEVDQRTVVRADGTTTQVAGPWAANIRLLTGALVSVCGARSSTAMGPTIEAASVSLREVDGMPAHLGTLRRAGAAWQLEPLAGGPALPLAVVPSALERAESEMVWVSGAQGDAAFTVRAFGVLGGWERE